MPRITKIDVDAETPWKHEPGSAEAIGEGCTCSQARNNGGKGELQADGYHWFPDFRCPIHGIAANRRAGVLNLPAKPVMTANARRNRQRRRR
jgi:hypothetical protein